MWSCVVEWLLNFTKFKFKKSMCRLRLLNSSVSNGPDQKLTRVFNEINRFLTDRTITGLGFFLEPGSKLNRSM